MRAPSFAITSGENRIERGQLCAGAPRTSAVTLSAQWTRGVRAFQERLRADLAHLVPEAKRAALLRILHRDPPLPQAFKSWLDAHARENWSRIDDIWFGQSPTTWNVVTAFAKSWFHAGEAELQRREFSYAIHSFERSLELVPEFAEATAQLKVANDQRDAGRWLVLEHDSYAREDNRVGEFPNRAAAEARVKELNALGGAHHWCTATT